ncbi:zinc ribbon domain-containing protein [Planococcus shenhongbingii]|uniref:Zinc ribbon domain-containing protein n=1 Tax=Planococcus shenhongbingii TaxID=3058398 RepID=A0ABT8N9S7_9BACL|nr:zinc ribbon domain-containing protein [Planococcus sp. N017]MDN7244646.1 zinc ribbon domain-containing protein [Planococcus sp. N017]
MSKALNNVEGNIEKTLQYTDQRLFTEKEAVEAQKTIDGLRQKRQVFISEIGMKAHQKIRLNELVDSDLTIFAKYIEEIDKEIYKLARAIEGMKSSSANTDTCPKCNTVVFSDSKFCGSCGTPVVIPEKIIEVLKACQKCEEIISDSAVFCPCCGQETQGV